MCDSRDARRLAQKTRERQNSWNICHVPKTCVTAARQLIVSTGRRDGEKLKTEQCNCVPGRRSASGGGGHFSAVRVPSLGKKSPSVFADTRGRRRLERQRSRGLCARRASISHISVRLLCAMEPVDSSGATAEQQPDCCVPLTVRGCRSVLRSARRNVSKPRRGNQESRSLHSLCVLCDRLAFLRSAQPSMSRLCLLLKKRGK